MEDWVFLVQSTPEIVYEIVTAPRRAPKRSRYKQVARAAVLIVQFFLWLKSI